MFVEPLAPQVYYAPPVQATQTPTPILPAPFGQVFAQKNCPTQPTPNNQQGQVRNNRARNQGKKQPQGGSQQPNPPNNVGAIRPAQNPQQQNQPRCNAPLRTNQPCKLCEVYGHYTHECPFMGRAKQAIHNEAQHATNTAAPDQPNSAQPRPPPMVLQNPLLVQGLVTTVPSPQPNPTT